MVGFRIITVRCNNIVHNDDAVVVDDVGDDGLVGIDGVT